MPRPIREEGEAINADSFLDIVASVVSVMIIMVMMTGLKIKNTPIEVVPTAETSLAVADLKHDAQHESTLRGEVMRVAAEIDNIQNETAIRTRQRDMLAFAVTSLEQRVQGTRDAVDRPTAQDTELAGKLAEEKNRLEDLERQRVAVESAPAPAVRIENYPTPLSRAVDGRELHFQLRGEKIVFIPLEPLLAAFESDATHKIYKLRDLPELTDVVGPEGGFRLRYTFERHESTEDEIREGARAGTFARLKRWSLIPVSEDMGETVEQALAQGSQFRMALLDRRARDATITIWTYPDSFSAFRTLKKELYRLGFPVAARPMPDGAPISGSPSGTKSSAE